jgi:hypothetical protein
MPVLYICVIAVFALAARWFWFQNQKALGDLGFACLGLGFLALVGFLFIESEWPWWARLIVGGMTFILCFSAQDILAELEERRAKRHEAPIPKEPVDHDYTLPGYAKKPDDFNIV